MAGPVWWCSPDNHTCNFMSHPFVEAICRNEASSRFHCITKCRRRRRCFRSCVNHSRSAGHVLSPRRNETPANVRNFPHGFLWVLPDDWHTLRRCDVVARTPVCFTGHTIEVLLDDLLPSRQSVASAHVVMPDRQGGCSARHECPPSFSPNRSFIRELRAALFSKPERIPH